MVSKWNCFSRSLDSYSMIDELPLRVGEPFCPSQLSAPIFFSLLPCPSMRENDDLGCDR